MITTVAAQAKFGAPGVISSEVKYMEIWQVPADLRAMMPALPGRIYINKSLRPRLERALRLLVERGYAHELKTWDGCYLVRKQRGSWRLSLHSWGLAVDVNAAWNQLGQRPALSAGFVQCFVDAGFDWGGHFKGDRVDGMHFQISEL